MIYHKDVETPNQKKHTIGTLLDAIKKIMTASGFKNDTQTESKVIEDLKKKLVWFLDNLSIFEMPWDKLRDAHCIFVAYMMFLHDYQLEVPIRSLVERYQLFH